MYNAGLRNMDLTFILRQLCAPVIGCLGIALSLPYIFAKSIVPAFGRYPVISLYKTIVRPHLEYCIQAWRPYRKDIDMLERVQRRATKKIPKLSNISYEMHLKMWINNTRNKEIERRSDRRV